MNDPEQTRHPDFPWITRDWFDRAVLSAAFAQDQAWSTAHRAREARDTGDRSAEMWQRHAAEDAMLARRYSALAGPGTWLVADVEAA